MKVNGKMVLKKAKVLLKNYKLNKNMKIIIFFFIVIKYDSSGNQ